MIVTDADPWPDPIGAIAESKDLGFAPEPTTVSVAGTRWFTLFATPFAVGNFGGRLMLVGPTASALFSTNYNRDHLNKLLWCGATSDLRWRRLGGWLFGLGTPDGFRFYPDVSRERRKLLAIEELAHSCLIEDHADPDRDLNRDLGRDRLTAARRAAPGRQRCSWRNSRQA